MLCINLTKSNITEKINNKLERLREIVIINQNKRRTYQKKSFIAFMLFIIVSLSSFAQQNIPPIPENFQAVVSGTNNVTLSWTSAGSGLRYEVYYNTQNNPSSPSTAILDTIDSTLHTIFGLHDGTHYFWVRSLRSGQRSGWSQVQIVRIPASSSPASTTLSGTYVYGTDNWITFTGNNFRITSSRYDDITGTYTVSGLTFTLQGHGSTASWLVGTWSIVNTTTIKDSDGDNWMRQTQTLTPIITINRHPASKTNVTVGNISGSLTVSVSVTQRATIYYQWYKNTTNSNSGGTAISGETRESFTIPTNLSAGTYYYYCVVSAIGMAPKHTNVAKVTVNNGGIKGLRNDGSLWSFFGIEGGIFNVNEPDGSIREPYIFSFLKYNMKFFDGIMDASAQLDYQLNFVDGQTDSKGNDVIGWSWLGFDICVNLYLIESFCFYFTHEINYQITPDYYWGSTDGNGYNGLFSFGGKYELFIENLYPYIELYFPVTYARAHSIHFDTQVELQAYFGLSNIFSTGIGMWVRSDFGFTDGSKMGKDNDSIYRGITFQASYQFDIPLYINIEIGIPNIDKYGIDLTLYARYRIGRITPWFQLPINYLGNDLNRDSIINFKLGATYSW